MNFFVVFIVGICMAVSHSNFRGGDPVSARLAWQLLIVMAFMLCAPAMAYFQTRWISSTLRSASNCATTRQSILRRLSACHMGVWSVSCLLIFCTTAWPEIVSHVWNLKSIPLLYEMVLCSPIVIAQTLSWAAFYDLQHVSRQQSLLESLRHRWSFVRVRLRLQALMLFAPLLMVLLAIRMARVLDGLSVWQSGAFAIGVCVSVMMLFPWLMTKVWPTEPIQDRDLHFQLMRSSASTGMRVDRILRWKTGPEIVNAAVTGVWPLRRTILLTDGLLNQFEPEEIEAIVRHEAGHVHRKHLLWKMLFVMLPLTVLVIDSTDSSGVAAGIRQVANQWNWPWAAKHATYLIAAGFALYLAVVLRWLSHQMEFEADLFAASGGGDSQTDRLEAIDQTRGALWRLAALMPQQFRKNSMLHPSLRNRILKIEDFARDRDVESAFRRCFGWHKRVVVMVWAVLLIRTLL